MKEQSKEQKHHTKNQADAAEHDNSAEKKKEENTYRLNTGYLPAIMMLAGGLLASVITYINHYALTEMLKIVLVSLVAFFILGVGIKKIFDSFLIPIKKKEEEAAEGEVIEKEPDNAKEEKSENGRK